MNFFDGQGILVRGDRYDEAAAMNSAANLNGANICVGIGTTTEGNMQDWFSSRGISFTSVLLQMQLKQLQSSSMDPVMLSLVTCLQWSLRSGNWTTMDLL